MGRLLTGAMSDANLCELGRVSAAHTLQQTNETCLGKLSVSTPIKRSSSAQEHQQLPAGNVC